MKLLKLKCNNYDCDCEFYLDYEWIMKEHDKIPNYFICPECEHSIWVDDNCIIELKENY